MNIKQIKGYATNNRTFERGLDYYESNHVQNYRLQTGDTITLTADVVGSLNNIYKVKAEIGYDQNLKDYHCQCIAHETYKGCCKHVVALLLKYYYDIGHKPSLITQVQTKTDDEVRSMIKEYTTRNINLALQETSYQKVRLIPHLVISRGQNIMLRFLIGHVRPYVLKSIQDFVLYMNEKRIVSYGKNLTVYHDLLNFTEDSRDVVKFLLDTYNDITFYDNRASYYRYIHDPRYLILSPRSLDQFFNIYVNKTITIEEDFYEKEILLTDEKPNIVLSIKPYNEDSFKVSININDALLLRGEKYQYLLFENKLYRLSPEIMDKIDVLIKAMQRKGSGLIINRLDMSSFCANVLNIISDVVNIDADLELLREFEPVPLITNLYIDLDKDNVITAKLVFNYGDIEINALEDTQTDFYRNVKDELIAKNLIKKYFEAEDKVNLQYVIYDSDLIINLYTGGLTELAKYMHIYVSERFRQIVRKPPTIRIGVRVDNSLLDLTIDTEDFPLEELKEILETYKAQKKYYRLKDGSFLNLEDETIGDFLELAEGLDLEFDKDNIQEVSVPRYYALYLDNILKTGKGIKSERDNTFKEIVRDLRNVDDTAFQVPEHLNNILRNYQKTGFRWLKTLSYYGFGGVLADDMGLGKTIQMIALIDSYLSENPNYLPSLVTCPTSLILNWEMEFNKFAPHIKVLTIMGPLETRQELISHINDYHVIITSYDYLKRDISLYRDVEFMYHIIDEAQYIKNHLTQNARSVKRIKSNLRFALTGTPIENNLAEIWSIFDFILPGYLLSYQKFNKEYEIPIIRDNNEEKLNKLKRLVTPFILRRLKKDVLKELPPKTETVLYTKLEGEQEKLYLANLALVKKEITEKINLMGLNQSRIMILSMLTRLRQICCDPRLYYDNYKGESAKLDMCLELLETTIQSGHKVLLFSQFTSMLAIIREELEKRKISYYLLQGSTPKEERLWMVEKFNNDDTKVFLISLKAGGTGLNLTSADVVIHYDPWWNLSAENQATDRTHRIGQTETVQVYKLIAKDTIEEKILHLQEAKQKLADSVIVEDDGIITRMTDEEILSLFK